MSLQARRGLLGFRSCPGRLRFFTFRRSVVPVSRLSQIKQVRRKRVSPIEYLYRGLAHGPDTIAIAGPGAPVTYRELVALVETMAAALQSLDATPGSRVGICARNTPEHLITL